MPVTSFIAHPESSMSRRAEVIIVTLIVLLVGGLAVTAVARVRGDQARTECKINLGMLGIGLHNYHDTYAHFPAGTLPNPDVPPERRLSWYVGAWAYVGDGQMGPLLIDKSVPWDYEINLVPGWRQGGQPVPLGEFRPWLCPSNSRKSDPGMPALAHYVGLAGVGGDAALLTVEDKRAGVFGYDRKTRLDDIKDGTGTTLLVIETMRDNGPWTAGGRPTVRGLDPAQPPYFGRDGQFSSGHRGVTNAVFVDGSVRSLKAEIAPDVFEALATIAGDEQVGRVGDD
jgi:prepilin-type processing-associated H-X9-DG protein